MKCQCAWIVICALSSATSDAQESSALLPKNGSISHDWSFRAGAQLDNDGRPVTTSPSKPGWSWGVAVSGSFRISWGESKETDPPPHDATDWETRLIELTNAERQKQSRKPYKIDAALMKLAREQSVHMARLKQISHELEGRTFALRMKEAGYKALAAGENCAEGADTPEMAVADWMMSEGHKGNIISERYTHIGVGVAEDTAGKRYFTQIFAKPLEVQSAPKPSK